MPVVTQAIAGWVFACGTLAMPGWRNRTAFSISKPPSVDHGSLERSPRKRTRWKDWRALRMLCRASKWPQAKDLVNQRLARETGDPTDPDSPACAWLSSTNATKIYLRGGFRWGIREALLPAC